MMEAVRGLVLNVTLIILLTTLLDLLLPEGRLQPFVKLVMGLFVVISMLNPLLNFLRQGETLQAWVLEEPIVSEQWDSIMAQGKFLQENRQQEIWQQYAIKLQEQVEALLLLLEDGQQGEAAVAVDEETGALQYIQVTFSGVRQEQLEQRLKQLLSGYYSLSEDKIEITWLGEIKDEMADD